MAGYSVTYTVVDNATKQIDAINRRIAQTRAPLDRMSRSISRFIDVSGLRKVATGFEWIGKAAASVLRTLTAIVPVMGAITGAASIVGMVKLVQSYSDWSQQLVQNADDIGMTTQQLQRFQDAARLAGGRAEDMTTGLKSLHDKLADINIGRGNVGEAVQMLERLGINMRDANGHMRSAADLMPELLQKIGAMKDPADRARFATELLGGQGDKLVETFRQSSQTFAQWFNDVSRYKDLTDEQKRSLQLFTEAQGRLGVAFDRLGQQISAMVARDFGPLLQRFAEFIEKHTPEILAAVDKLSRQFAAWLAGIEWKNVEAGVNRFIEALKWVVNNLDTIKLAVEAIAALFVVKWGIDVVKAIGAVTTAIGSVAGGAGSVAGVGLLGALGAIGAAVAAIMGTLALGAAYETPETRKKREELDRTMRPVAPPNMPTSDYWIDAQGRKHDATTGAIIAEPPAVRGLGGSPFQLQSGIGGYLPGGVTPAAFRVPGQAPGAQSPNIQNAVVKPPGAMNLPEDSVQRGAAITARLAADLGLSHAQAAGIVGNLQAESGIRAIQEKNPLGGGRGGFGWAQWTGQRRIDFENYARMHQLDPKSDEANYGFLLQELKGPEGAKFMEELRSLKGPDAAKQAAALVERKFERPAVSNAGVRGKYADQFANAVTVPPPAPVNGAVDVSITHRNPPPNSAVTASGTGSVNVAPVRVEHQNMADI